MMEILRSDALECMTLESYLDLLCWRNQRHNILALRKFLGPAELLTLLENFAGAYVRFPSAVAASTTADDLQLAILWKTLKQQSKRNLLAWNTAESRFIHLAQRLGYRYDRAVERSKRVLRELEDANRWVEVMRRWETKKAEDL